MRVMGVDLIRSKLIRIISRMPGDVDDTGMLPDFAGSFPSSVDSDGVSLMLDYGEGRRFMKLLRSGKITLERSPGSKKRD